ncbi:MAG TPA: sulfatase [Vicinamibacteria bacterium]|nr:sulfatase [Vicinamibacteria bacterium]
MELSWSNKRFSSLCPGPRSGSSPSVLAGGLPDPEHAPGRGLATKPVLQSAWLRATGRRASAALLLLVLSSCGGRGAVNVVLISLDTLRADRLNCYGYRARVVSPNIDALARDGVLFEAHIAAAPWTTPSHMSLLTSLYPTSHGVTASIRSIKQVIQGASPGEYERLNSSRTTLAEVFAGKGFATAAFTGGGGVDPQIGFGRGFSVYDTSMVKLDSRDMRTMYSWIDGQKDRPFFIFWHTYEVHAPYFETTFLADVLPRSKAAEIEGAYQRLPRERESPRAVQILKDFGAFDPVVSDALYTGGVRAVDRWVGEFIGFLKTRGLYERTLIVLTSDHGEQLGERALDAGDWCSFYDCHGHTLFDELVRVPLIVKLPSEQHAGTRMRSVSSALDVMPTILDVVRLSGPTTQMQGVSLRARWEGRAQGSPSFAYSESLAGDTEAKSVRSEHLKYTLRIRADTVSQYGRAFIPLTPDKRELYDLEADPGERRNLLSSSAAQSYARLAAMLDAALRRQTAGRVGHAEGQTLAKETMDRLRSLGYIR